MVFFDARRGFWLQPNLATQAYGIPDANRQLRRNRSGFLHFHRSRVVVGSDLILR
jgi:hypothetical protein